MMYEIKLTRSHATCGGGYARCDSYKDHPKYPVLQHCGKHIPSGEYALFVGGDRKYCVCFKHAPEVIAQLQTEISAATEMAKKLKWVK